MAYEPTIWTDKTPINTENLNKLEQGVVEASKNSGGVGPEIKQEIYDAIFPIGYTFIDVVGTIDYSNHLGLTWQKTLQGVTPIGLKSDDTDFGTMAKTGGAKTVTLSKANLPNYNLYSASHTHTFTGTAQSHGHTFTGTAESHNHRTYIGNGTGSGSYVGMPRYTSTYKCYEY